jgi:hypothetical protein
MPSKKFYTLLFLTVLFTVCLLFVVFFFFPPLYTYAKLGWASLALFINITLLMFFLGKKTITSPNKFLFSNLSMGFIFLKMVMSLMIIVTYKKMTHPASNLFIVPFFIVYLTFTIFETYLMLKMTQK